MKEGKKMYGNTQTWHMSTCKKDILDYTRMAHECLPKRHIILNKNACKKDIWDHTKMAL
jgi:hypothetical protein